MYSESLIPIAIAAWWKKDRSYRENAVLEAGQKIRSYLVVLSRLMRVLSVWIDGVKGIPRDQRSPRYLHPFSNRRLSPEEPVEGELESLWLEVRYIATHTHLFNDFCGT